MLLCSLTKMMTAHAKRDVTMTTKRMKHPVAYSATNQNSDKRQVFLAR